MGTDRALDFGRSGGPGTDPWLAMSQENSRDLLEQFRAGDDQAAAALFARYFERLVLLARSRLSAKLARRVDAEDVVQSAYRTFFAHARNGEFVLQRSGALWSLLVAITLNKVRSQAEHHSARKRSMADEHESPAHGTLAGIAPEQLADDPSPSVVLGVTEELQHALGPLTPVQRQMVELRLQGHTLDEIAELTSRSERTVRRLLDSLKEELENRLGACRSETD